MTIITRAAGMKDYSHSGTSKFIPQLWHGEIVEKFYPATCLHKIASTRYEGTISGKGDSVIIRTGPDIAWTDGEIMGEVVYAQPESANIELYIDQLKRFGVIVDSVDKIQSDLELLTMWTQDAAEQKKVVVEKEVFQNVYTQASHFGATAGSDANINLGAAAAPVDLTSDNIVDFILDIGQIKDENNVPESQRWTILPPWAVRLLKGSEIKDASLTGDGMSVLRNGRVGMVDRETTYLSNNLLTVTDTGEKCTHIISGHPKGLTFASQIDSMDSGKSEKYFGEWIRGQVVFGYKAIKPETLIHGYIHRA